MKSFLIASNSTTGAYSEGNMTFTAESAFNERYLFSHIHSGKKASPAGKGDVASGKRALGIATDIASVNQPINVQIFGSNASTMKVVAGGTITAGDFLTSDAASKAINYQTATAAGTHFIYGIALSDAAPGQLVEFTPTPGLEKTL